MPSVLDLTLSKPIFVECRIRGTRQTKFFFFLFLHILLFLNPKILCVGPGEGSLPSVPDMTLGKPHLCRVPNQVHSANPLFTFSFVSFFFHLIFLRILFHYNISNLNMEYHMLYVESRKSFKARSEKKLIISWSCSSNSMYIN